MDRWLYLSVGVTEEFKRVCIHAHSVHSTLNTLLHGNPSEPELIIQITSLNQEVELFLYTFTQFTRKCVFEDKSDGDKKNKKDLESKMDKDVSRIREFIKQNTITYGTRAYSKKSTSLIPYLTTIQQALSMTYIFLIDLKKEWYDSLGYTHTQNRVNAMSIVSDISSLFNTALTFNIMSYLPKVYAHLDKLYSRFSTDGKLLMIKSTRRNYPKLQEFYLLDPHKTDVADSLFEVHVFGQVVLEELESLDAQITRNINNLPDETDLTRAVFGFQEHDEDVLFRKMPESLKLVTGSVSEPGKFLFQKSKGVPVIESELTPEDEMMLDKEEGKKGE